MPRRRHYRLLLFLLFFIRFSYVSPSLLFQGHRELELPSTYYSTQLLSAASPCGVDCYFSDQDVKTDVMQPNTLAFTFCRGDCKARICPTPYVKIGAIGCFLFHEATSTFADARSYCQGQGGDLATPSDLEPLRQHLLTGGFTGEYWVGLESPGGWIDGRAAVASEWADIEPNFSGACARLRDSSEFKAADHGCNNNYKVICETNLYE